MSHGSHLSLLCLLMFATACMDSNPSRRGNRWDQIDYLAIQRGNAINRDNDADYQAGSFGACLDDDMPNHTCN